MPLGGIAESPPPQNITSARPSRIASRPSPIAICEAAQAAHDDRSGPRVPSSIETRAAAAFGITANNENGLTRPGPPSPTVSQQPSSARIPPIAVATEAPTRSGSFPISIPASASACRAAATTSCANRSICRARRDTIQRAGSNSFASQAKPTGKPLASNAPIGPAAERPSTKRSQLNPTPSANGVTAPNPVTTTRRHPSQPTNDRSPLCPHQTPLTPTRRTHPTSPAERLTPDSGRAERFRLANDTKPYVVVSDHRPSRDAPHERDTTRSRASRARGAVRAPRARAADEPRADSAPDADRTGPQAYRGARAEPHKSRGLGEAADQNDPAAADGDLSLTDDRIDRIESRRATGPASVGTPNRVADRL